MEMAQLWVPKGAASCRQEGFASSDPVANARVDEAVMRSYNTALVAGPRMLLAAAVVMLAAARKTVSSHKRFSQTTTSALRPLGQSVGPSSPLRGTRHGSSTPRHRRCRRGVFEVPAQGVLATHLSMNSTGRPHRPRGSGAGPRRRLRLAHHRSLPRVEAISLRT
jgi:hypothetical protein